MAQGTLMSWVKRPREEPCSDVSSPSKRLKVSCDSAVKTASEQLTPPATPPSEDRSQLSKEQKERMEQNRLAALSRKAAPGEIGPTWKRALSAEFQKPYYLKVAIASAFCGCSGAVYRLSPASTMLLCPLAARISAAGTIETQSLSAR